MSLFTSWTHERSELMDTTTLALIMNGGALAALAAGHRGYWYFGWVVTKLITAKDDQIAIERERRLAAEKNAEEWRVMAYRTHETTTKAVDVAVAVGKE